MRIAHSFFRISRVVLLLGLLAAMWAGTVQGQEPGPEPDMARFLEQRIREPDLFSQHSVTENDDSASSQYLPMWRIETVHDGLYIGGNDVSLVLDRAGLPHIAYCTDDPRGLAYSYYDGFAWHFEIAEEQVVGQHPVLALDAAGRPHIAYEDIETDAVKYVHYDGGSWQISTVDSGWVGGTLVSLALDANGQPHIAYTYDKDLRYAYYDGVQWHSETVDSNSTWAMNGISLALDSSGHPHICYAIGSGLQYAMYDGSAWQIQLIGEDGTYPSFALDAADHPHISYVSSESGFRVVKYAYYDGVTWQTTSVEQLDYAVSAFTSLALDADSQPHISYTVSNLPGEVIKHSYREGAAWKMGLVDNVYSTDQISLALDLAGQPRLAYTNGSSLKYAIYVSDLADWSRLTFASFRDKKFWDVYAGRGDGTSLVQITDDSRNDSSPKFSRDAAHVVFRSDRDGNNEIYCMNADGSSQTRLTESKNDEFQPTWSPDGSQIAFYYYINNNADIYVMNADGTDRIRLTTDPAWDGQPAWSPDGSQILFVSNRNGQYELWTMQADGSGQQQLTSGLSYAAYPDWSPDGKSIVFNDDANSDGWLDVAIVQADGTGLDHPLGFSPDQFDSLAPVWASAGEDIAFAQVHWISYAGNWYWDYSRIYRAHLNTGLTYQLTDSYYDWWPDWQATDVSVPTSRVSVLPGLSDSTFTIHWSGDDASSGIKSYDIQFRDGPGGIWRDWLSNTGSASAAFEGQAGHTYYFRCRARDFVGNVEPYPEGEGDTFTHVYGYTLAGRILGNRDQPLALAAVESTPAALNVDQTGPAGSFALYFDGSGIYDLKGAHVKFGALPPMVGIEVAEASLPVTLYLPPADDRIADGGFEAGDLAAWNLSGADYPALTTAAHTGGYAVLLDGADSRLSQAIALPSVPYSGTLSLLYRAEAADPAGDDLTISITGDSQAFTYTVPLTGDGWVHWWTDAESWADPTATLQMAWTEADARSPGRTFVDEISLGTAETGAYAVYVPAVLRARP